MCGQIGKFAGAGFVSLKIDLLFSFVVAQKFRGWNLKCGREIGNTRKANFPIWCVVNYGLMFLGPFTNLDDFVI